MAISTNDWNAVWQIRGKSYHEANARFPEARNTERELMIAGLDLRPQLTLLDVAAGGGYHIERVRALFGDAIELLAIEPSDTFARHLPAYARRLVNSTITAFELPDGSVDRTANLSGLHHTPDNHRFFAECHRELRSGGRCAVADVRQGSAVDAWLNQFVNANNSEGHDGTFFAHGEFTDKLLAAGFKSVSEDCKRYTWDFTSVDEMTFFVRLLFGLDRATPEQVERGISEILGYTVDPSGDVRMNWELIYAFGVKA
ncbi:MAG TPA: methyltransferase domain-containing protein [Candidatus Udaeobacter sp.]|nr:methyltransferase domain-containing protein [Candidatus Udaeobacter sp.]